MAVASYAVVKRHKIRFLSDPMTNADQYRKLAAQLTAKARDEKSPDLRAEWNHLAQSYLRLAAQAERNARADVTYEPALRPRLDDLGGEPA